MSQAHQSGLNSQVTELRGSGLDRPIDNATSGNPPNSFFVASSPGTRQGRVLAILTLSEPKDLWYAILGAARAILRA
jgi:hypothetical protein